MTNPIGDQNLSRWFGLSYASFLTMPRVLMADMPDEWKGRMAKLLEEYDETFPNQQDLPHPYVSARKNNKFTSWPEWVLNYRYPDKDEINKLK